MSVVNKKRLSRDVINGSIGVVVSVALIISALRLPPSTVPDDVGPAVFPIIAALMILIPSLVLVYNSLKSAEEYIPFLNKEEWKRFWLLVGVMILYVVLLYVAGFLIATPIVMFIICLMFSKGKQIPKWRFAVYSLVFTLALYLAFYKGMGLKLPLGEFITLQF